MECFYIEARDIPDAWFQTVELCYQKGKDYLVGQGSYAGSQHRRELDYLTIHIRHPQTRPLLPEVPPGLGIPNPVPEGMDYIERYLEYLMTDSKQPGEDYTYGSRLFGMIHKEKGFGLSNKTQTVHRIREELGRPVDEVIKKLKETYNTNQASLSISQPGDVFLNDPPCFPPGTFVWTERGALPIEVVTVGDVVQTHTGKWREVIETHTRPYEGNVVKVTFRGNALPLIATPEHPIRVVRGQRCPYGARLRCKPTCKKQMSVYKGTQCPQVYKTYKSEWVNCGDLRDTDYLVIPRGRGDIEIDRDEAFIIGMYLAQGWPTKMDGLSFAIDDKKPDVARMLIEAMRSTYGLEPHIDGNYQGCSRYTFYSRSIAKKYVQWCGKGARTKAVSPHFYSATRSSLRDILRGWELGDGWRDDRRAVIATTSASLMQFCLYALIATGHNPSVTYQTAKDSCINERIIKANGGVYSLGWTHTVRNRYWWKDENFLYVPVKTVTTSKYDGTVHNLGVAVDNSYVANSAAVHNCLRHLDLRIYEEEKKLHFIIYFRSWDAYCGLPANLAGLAHLQEYMALEIGVEPGEFICSSKGIHLYDMYFSLAKIRLGD